MMAKKNVSYSNVTFAGSFFAIAVLVLASIHAADADVLTPPMVNLARGRRITASSTCGIGVNEPELFCQLTGANIEMWEDAGVNLIQGQMCDYCSPNSHPAEFAIDGTERWWQSPPLSRGMSYNEVNLTVDLGQASFSFFFSSTINSMYCTNSPQHARHLHRLIISCLVIE
jgi:laminin alpha 3/5